MNDRRLRWFCAVIVSGCLSAPAALPPYGVNAHLAGDEYRDCAETLDMMRIGKVGVVRSDLHWRLVQPTPGASYDFSRFDKVMDEAEKNGIEVLPIIGDPPAWAHPFSAHTDEIVALCKAFAERYKGRFGTLEFMNEENYNRECNGTNTVVYGRTLKRVREAVRAVDPRLRVAIGGIGGGFVEFLRTLYGAGYKDAFDVMNLHPYSNPQPPECVMHVRLENQIEAARKVMAEFGDGKKPVIATEVGWSTQSDGIGNVESTVLQTGLRLARPAQKTWRAAYVEPVPAGTFPPPDVARAVLGLLPPGSTVKTANASSLAALLAADELDCVIYPVRNESYPAAVQDAVADFVKKGGVLVDLGGIPVGTPDDPARDAAADRRELRLDVVHSGLGPQYPEKIRAFATARAKESGFTADLSGYMATRFLTAKQLKAGDELIPLVSAVRENGEDLVAAGVYKFGSDLKGSVVVSALITLHPAQQIGTTTEEDQGLFIARAMGIAFAMDLESFFVYEFRSPEGPNTYYSECHYGMVHDNFAPKPAFSAYKTFAYVRPAGSVNIAGKWHDEKKEVHATRWKRPDGREAGMFWTFGKPVDRTRKFDRKVRFLNVWGREIRLPSSADGTYTLPITGSPIYYLETGCAK